MHNLSLSQLTQLHEDQKSHAAYYTDLTQEIFKKSAHKIKVRILCQQILQTTFQVETSLSQQISTLFKNWFNKQTKFDGIIVHIHGGGFISSNSGVHQNYTRKWANSISAPIFSIDYRLAPGYNLFYSIQTQFARIPFPKCLGRLLVIPSLDSICFYRQVYNWILKNIAPVFNIKAEKIIIAGDSAGGNLAAALTILCIQNNIKVPSGLFLAYPGTYQYTHQILLALDLTETKFTPSYLQTFDDPILPYTFLLMCTRLYLQNQDTDNSENHLISPLYTPHEILKQFPPTRIMVGTNDPFHDDCWRFTSKLQSLNRNVKLFIINQIPHGFLNFDMKGGIPQCSYLVGKSIQIIQELLEI